MLQVCLHNTIFIAEQFKYVIKYHNHDNIIIDCFPNREELMDKTKLLRLVKSVMSPVKSVMSPVKRVITMSPMMSPPSTILRG